MTGLIKSRVDTSRRTNAEVSHLGPNFFYDLKQDEMTGYMFHSSKAASVPALQEFKQRLARSDLHIRDNFPQAFAMANVFSSEEMIFLRRQLGEVAISARKFHFHLASGLSELPSPSPSLLRAGIICAMAAV